MPVGALVVKLGLDAAEFTQGLTKAEYQARKFGEAIGDGIRTSALVGSAAILSIGAAALTANAAFNKLLDGAAKFQDLAEETGAAAVNIAGLAVAAGTAGVSIESVAGSMVKLTKNLTGIDDESKAAGSALAAIGLKVTDFKKLDPVAQYEGIAKALAGYADGAGKTAVAVALFGKAGAEQLKVMKAVDEQGGRSSILTKEQIALSDEYRDRQAKLRTEIGLYATAIATQFIEPTNVLMGLLRDAAKEFVNTGGAVTALGVNQGVQNFAENAGRALAGVIDYAVQAKKEFNVLADFVGSTIEAIGKYKSLDFDGGRKVGEDFRKRYGLDEMGRRVSGEAGAAAGKTFVEKYDAELGRLRNDRNRLMLNQSWSPTAGKDLRAGVTFNGPPPKAGGGGKDTSAQEAKERLSSDLDAIKNAQEAITNTYANQEKILEAVRAAGLTDETQYYAEKQRLLAQTSAAQEAALNDQIIRLQKEDLSGKDAIANARKIADAEAKILKIQQDSATQSQVLTYQQKDGIKKLAQAYADAQAAAQSYLDVVSRAAQAEIAGVGKGDKARGFTAGISAIDEKTEAARQALQRDNRNGKFAGRPEDYQRELALLNSSQEAEIAIYKAKYATLDGLQKNWINGATEALHNYADEAGNVAKNMETTIGNALKGIEDQFVNLFTGKKFDTKALVQSITSDLARNFVKEQITGPLAKMSADALGDGGFLSGLFGGSGGKGYSKSDQGGLDSLISSITGGAGGQAALAASTSATSVAMTTLTAAATAAAAALSSMSLGSSLSGLGGGGGGDVLGTFISGLGGMASGGNLEPWGMTRVNENGPELLDVNGKQYLMNGGRNARVTPNHRLGGAGGVTINQSFPPGTNRQTTDQAALSAGRAIQRAQRIS